MTWHHQDSTSSCAPRARDCWVSRQSSHGVIWTQHDTLMRPLSACLSPFPLPLVSSDSLGGSQATLQPGDPILPAPICQEVGPVWSGEGKVGEYSTSSWRRILRSKVGPHPTLRVGCKQQSYPAPTRRCLLCAPCGLSSPPSPPPSPRFARAAGVDAAGGMQQWRALHHGPSPRHAAQAGSACLLAGRVVPQRTQRRWHHRQPGAVQLDGPAVFWAGQGGPQRWATSTTGKPGPAAKLCCPRLAPPFRLRALSPCPTLTHHHILRPPCHRAARW